MAQWRERRDSLRDGSIWFFSLPSGGVRSL